MTNVELLSFAGWVAAAWALGFSAGWTITIFRSGINHIS